MIPSKALRFNKNHAFLQHKSKHPIRSESLHSAIPSQFTSDKSIHYIASPRSSAKHHSTGAMHSSLSLASLAAVSVILAPTTALGINCRGSGLCPRASWNDQSSETVVQVLRDAIWADSDDNSTTYGNGDHIICVSQSQTITLSAGISTRAESEAGGSSGGVGVPSVSGSFSLSGSIGKLNGSSYIASASTHRRQKHKPQHGASSPSDH